MAETRRNPEASLYRRNAARITTREVLHASDKQAKVAEAPALRRHAVRKQLEAEWAEQERVALHDTGLLLTTIRTSVEDLSGALDKLAALRAPELMGKVETEQHRVKAALGSLADAAAALGRGDFGAAGSAVEEAERELWVVGGTLVVALNQALSQAAVGKEQRGELQDNLAERREAKQRLEATRDGGQPAKLTAAARVRSLDAAGFELAAQILSNQVRADKGTTKAEKIGRDGEIRVVPPQELETFDDVGGLEDIKQQLRSTIGAILERPDEAARYRVLHNGILFHGPPGTGKNLLSRALAGEYGMRYLRFSLATIASVYLHEAASNLRRLFELAKKNVPCLLFLDEIDTIASDRADHPSADHREVVTQLMVCLEEYRAVPGLVIAAATNDLDRLDPALREGRFDAKILIPLPDPASRKDVFAVHLQRRGEAVAWDGIDLEVLSQKTNAYSAAAIETVVSSASQAAMQAGSPIGQEQLLKAIADRGGKHRLILDERITWADVVLADETREQVMEILNVFSQPDLARDLGVTPPAGILLHGPPGTGKTTIAKAMASEVQASFFEQSAADLTSKWAGESEQKVAKLFAKARANRPSIIFIDELDALLRRRTGDTNAKWEERVLSQFLRELDGLRGGEGVLLVGATNRPDVMDEAIVGRRLTPVEVGLPGATGRLQLLRLLCQDVQLDEAVNLREVASLTEGMSGADLRRLRNAAGMKALTRLSKTPSSDSNGGGSSTQTKREAAVTMEDFHASLDVLRGQSSLMEV